MYIDEKPIKIRFSFKIIKKLLPSSLSSKEEHIDSFLYLFFVCFSSFVSVDEYFSLTFLCHALLKLSKNNIQLGNPI